MRPHKKTKTDVWTFAYYVLCEDSLQEFCMTVNKAHDWLLQRLLALCSFRDASRKRWWWWWWCITRKKI